MAALTDIEQSKILRFLGYPDWSNLAIAWGLDFPTGVEPQYYVRDAFGRLTDEALELVRNDLRECEEIERQLSDARCRLKASKVGDITMNIDEIPYLRGELDHWKRQLADDFGSIINPFRTGQFGGSRSGRVIG